jgi:hypothetical protein
VDCIVRANLGVPTSRLSLQKKMQNLSLLCENLSQLVICNPLNYDGYRTANVEI